MFIFFRINFGSDNLSNFFFTLTDFYLPGFWMYIGLDTLKAYSKRQVTETNKR